MTAKKRYLPRVTAGVTEFKEVLSDSVKLSAFVENDLKSLLRAMDLYGQSLRRGEVPDDTSRMATTLTEQFKTAVLKLTNANDANKVKLRDEALQALDIYLKFAKISL
jgi:hypothetical protein